MERQTLGKGKYLVTSNGKVYHGINSDGALASSKDEFRKWAECDSDNITALVLDALDWPYCSKVHGNSVLDNTSGEYS